jgi:hypothetical protein
MAFRRSLEREFKLQADLELSLPDLREDVKGSTRLPEQQAQHGLLRYFGRAPVVHGDNAAASLWRKHPGSMDLKLPESASSEALERTELEWDGDRGQIPSDIHGSPRGSLATVIFAAAKTRKKPLPRSTNVPLSAALADSTTWRRAIERRHALVPNGTGGRTMGDR